MSSKNTLQEYCQKRKLPIPVYDTVQINNGENPPIFESSLIFDDIIYKAQGRTKVGAEKDVAKIVCEHLDVSDVSKPKHITYLTQKYENLFSIPIDKYNKIYLIDGDNCHITNEDVFECSDCLFIYFVAKNNTIPHCREQLAFSWD
jgi:Double-stranded RNA binding motif